MSTPAPPYPGHYMGKGFLQVGGPRSVSTGSTSAAITFGTAFPDTNYIMSLDWVSGSTPSYGARAKTVNSCIVVFTQVTVDSAFLWGAWRVT